jgi:diamine N-acetyltransferase
VGFLMLYDDLQKPEYHLWRFMIAGRYQGKGCARRAMALLIEHVRRRPMAEELVLSYVRGKGAQRASTGGWASNPRAKYSRARW